MFTDSTTTGVNDTDADANNTADAKNDTTAGEEDEFSTSHGNDNRFLLRGRHVSRKSSGGKVADRTYCFAAKNSTDHAVKCDSDVEAGGANRTSGGGGPIRGGANDPWFVFEFLPIATSLNASNNALLNPASEDSQTQSNNGAAR